MEIRQLITFSMVAETMSFSQAAQALNYAQSTVTAQIQALEEELGVPLFNRLGRRITLTEAGKRLQWYALKLTNLEEEARNVISEQDEPMGSLTFSAPESILTYHLPRVLRRYRDLYPQVQLIFHPHADHEMPNVVREGLIDVAFPLNQRIQAPNLHVTVLSHEPIVLVAPPDHALLDLKHIVPENIESESVIVTELGCNYRNHFENTVRAAGVTLRSRFELNNVQAIKQCVMVGLGIALLPYYTIKEEIADGRLVILPYEHQFYADMQLIYHRNRWMSPALSAFVELAEEMLKQDDIHTLPAS